jgi:hypothetical protein
MRRIDEAVADLAEDVGVRDSAILQHQLGGVRSAHAELVLLLAGPDAGPIHLDRERSHPALAVVAVGDGEYHCDLGMTGIGDEVLGAVEHPLVALAHRGGHQPGRVTAGAGFGQCPAAEPLATGEPGEVALPLFLGAGEVDVTGGERIVGRDRQRDARLACRQFLEDVDVVDVAEPGAAVALREDRTEEAEASQLLDDVEREGLRLVPLHDVRLDLGGGEVTHHLPDLLLLGCKVEVHGSRG